MIVQAIYGDFESIKGKKEKYGKEDIEELIYALSGLTEKFGWDKIKIFIRSRYFGKCVDRSMQ